MKRLLSVLVAAVVVSFLLPWQTTLAAGISPSGGGNVVVGQTFAVRVVASGVEFDSLQGTIATTGPVTVVSAVPGAATWLPGRSPSANGGFVGITAPTRNLTVVTINLRANSIGRGSVTLSGVRLARSGNYVGERGGTAGFTIGRAPTPPGEIALTSTTHPDSNISYEETTVTLNWTAPANGATGYSYVWNDQPETTPEPTPNTTTTTITFTDQKIGVYYFHIRAQNQDGWGPTARFKVTIREPDPKIDPALQAPTITSIENSDRFATDVSSGLVSGIKIKGSGGLTGFTIVLTIDPKDRLPEKLFQPIVVENLSEETVTPPTTEPTTNPEPTAEIIPTKIEKTPLMATPNEIGEWEIVINEPLPVGFYKVTAQGIKDKTLTPPSQGLTFELTVARGGEVRVITEADATVPIDTSFQVMGVSFATVSHFYVVLGILVGLKLILWLWLSFLSRRWPFKVRQTNNNIL